MSCYNESLAIEEPVPHLRTLRSAILELSLALLSALAAAQSYPGKPVRLEFRLRQARLFAFEVG